MDSANAVLEPYRRLLASNLVQRVTSAIVLLPLIALIVWWGTPLAELMVLVLALLALHELFGLFRTAGYRPRRGMGYLGVGLLIGAAALRAYVPFDGGSAALAALVLLALAWELPQRDRQQALLNWALTVAGVTYIGWTLAHFLYLRDLTHPLAATLAVRWLRLEAGAAWIVLVIAITLASDTAAYFIGRTWGRHRLAPYLSPKKSWEGAVAGTCGAALAAAILAPLLGLPLTLPTSLLLGVIGSIGGQIGDLAESFIKRQVNVKDSGHLIPGHGGVLDRLDSHLFTAPLLYYLILALLWAQGIAL
ncbi:phosphatidate cytidylyltransferase [Kallotenue papyrolyticum]|uniref:phosphatidate cytidylyltransferase n=1 Tax=Kallotenue papyrolyticum TaxID=1325125 RepID=UPI000693998D|nr:phosphatidate cytidylyltransferase [Kallotenue papyrolyticum]